MINFFGLYKHHHKVSDSGREQVLLDYFTACAIN